MKHDWASDGKHIVITLWADFPDGHSPTHTESPKLLPVSFARHRGAR